MVIAPLRLSLIHISPAAAGAVPGFTAAGKTGTAEVDTAEGNICWYVTYGPAESPGIVVAVVIEEGAWALSLIHI